MHSASALTVRPATLPAPGEDAHSARLDAAVDGVAFPYWTGTLGWRAAGERTDRVAGRAATTVFYVDREGRRIGYAIVAGAHPPHLGGGTVRWVAGHPYRVLSDHGTQLVTWYRDGRLCIIGGRGVSSTTLLRLASSDESATAT